jgi:Rrf2 family protein
MLAITRKADYALVAVADLAELHPSVVRTRDLALRRRIPGPVLQKILTALTNRGLLVSVQGPNGGYRLSRGPEKIALADVIEAIEGTFRFTCCTGPRTEHAKHECPVRSVCPVSGSMRKVHSLVEQCLTGVSIAQLASDTVPDTVTLHQARPRGRPKRSSRG